MLIDRLQFQFEDPSILKEQISLRNGCVMKNRIYKAPMVELLGSCDPTDISKRGIPTPKLINVYQKWGKGGFGMLLTGNVMVSPTHFEPGVVIFSSENDSSELRQRLKSWTAVAKEDGALMVAQLNHGSDKTPKSVNPNPATVTNLSEQMVTEEVVNRFAFAAKLAYETGFDGIQVHSAHGYLLAQFLDESTNNRIDKYGGTSAKRVLILREIYDRIRAVVPKEFVVGLKLNSVQFAQSEMKTIVEVCKEIETIGFDFVELSGGQLEGINSAYNVEIPASTTKRIQHYELFYNSVRPLFRGTPIFVTGNLRTVKGMTTAVRTLGASAVGIGKPATAEPDIAKKILLDNHQSCAFTKINPINHGMNKFASHAQIFQMGRTTLDGDIGRLYTDLSNFTNEEEANSFISFFHELQKSEKATAKNLENYDANG